MNIWENIAWHVTGAEGMPTEDMNPTPKSILGSDSTTLQTFWDFQIFLDVLPDPQTQYGPTRPPLLFLRSVNGILIHLGTKTRYRAKWPVTLPHLSSLTSNYEVLCTSLKTKQNPGIHPSFYSITTLVQNLVTAHQNICNRSSCPQLLLSTIYPLCCCQLHFRKMNPLQKSLKPPPAVISRIKAGFLSMPFKALHKLAPFSPFHLLSSS